jgi:adenosine deaminase
MHIHFLTSKFLLSLSLYNTQTDDYGVFQTTLTRELTIAADVYGLSREELIDLTENANKYSFARPHERQLIGDKIEEFKNKNFTH